MKKLSFFDKLVFIVNSIIAVLSLFSYAISYMTPKENSYVSLSSLFAPMLLIANFCFVIYWILKLKKQFFLSLLTLLIGYSHLIAFFQFSEKKVFLNDDLKIMSYNVRLFNAYKWSENDSLNHKIYNLIKEKDPDILAIQEFFPEKELNIKYPYSYISKNKKSKASQAIYSKHIIIHQGSLNFENSGNNAIFIDILKNEDTLRVYNIHLQSLSLDKNKENFGQKDSKKLLNRFKSSFTKQTKQVEKILQHEKKCPYKKIFLGDFNNTAFSWVYKQLKKEKKDAFIEAGSGFGKSLDYFFPYRIDFILADENVTINNFKTYPVKYSDHYPIMARINLTN